MAGVYVPGLIPARAGKTATCGAGCSPRAAHPRACGENSVSAGTAGANPGSSPRVRGKPPECLRCSASTRLIPARAGKTAGAGGATVAASAHPRACGENLSMLSYVDRDAGSSPRVRGKLSFFSQTQNKNGLIPARAGKTTGGARQRPSRRAHPRACGENHHREEGCRRAGGSSPRVRGKPPAQRQERDRGGLIPARAGKTDLVAAHVGARAAHPRACGENPTRDGASICRAGSSPRVRGKPRRGHAPRLRCGLIPARAGKTKQSNTPYLRPWAHPRACGENVKDGVPLRSALGSSPRVRGKRVGAGLRGVHGRLIPARAGKTSPNPARTPPRQAHPRACGENCWG